MDLPKNNKQYKNISIAPESLCIGSIFGKRVVNWDLLQWCGKQQGLGSKIAVLCDNREREYLLSDETTARAASYVANSGIKYDSSDADIVIGKDYAETRITKNKGRNTVSKSVKELAASLTEEQWRAICRNDSGY